MRGVGFPTPTQVVRFLLQSLNINLQKSTQILMQFATDDSDLPHPLSAVGLVNNMAIPMKPEDSRPRP